MARLQIESTLFEAAREGDAAAFSAIAHICLPSLYRWMKGLGGGTIDVEDATQDALVTLYKRFDKIERPEQVQAYLFGIAKRVAASHGRRAWVRRWLPGINLDLFAGASLVPDRPVERSQAKETVRIALESLPMSQREVLMLCDLEEHTAREVAEMLGLPLGTVKSRLRLARLGFERAVLGRVGRAHVNQLVDLGASS